MKHLTPQFLSHFTITAVFLLFIFAPPIATVLLSQPEWSFVEKRRLADLPTFSLDAEHLQQYPAQFEAYYNDRFGFREKLIRDHNRLMSKYFGKSPVAQVLIGKEGWLFYTGDRIIEDLIGTDPLTPDELETWRINLEGRRRWLTEQGIQYLFVVVPNKHTIYPEYLPVHLVRQNSRSRLDQLVEYLHDHSDIRILDLRSALLRAKKKHQVYYRTDTHINYNGAYEAYIGIMDRIREMFPEKNIPFRSFRETGVKPRRGGDLSHMLGLADVTEDDNPTYDFSSPCAMNKELAVASWDPANPSIPYLSECHSAQLRAIVFQDSFFPYIKPFIAEEFGQMVYIMKEYDHGIMKELLEKIKPQIVIEERAERLLYSITPSDPEITGALSTGK